MCVFVDIPIVYAGWVYVPRLFGGEQPWRNVLWETLAGTMTKADTVTFLNMFRMNEEDNGDYTAYEERQKEILNTLIAVENVLLDSEDSTSRTNCTCPHIVHVLINQNDNSSRTIVLSSEPFRFQSRKSRFQKVLIFYMSS